MNEWQIIFCVSQLHMAIAKLCADDFFHALSHLDAAYIIMRRGDCEVL